MYNGNQGCRKRGGGVMTLQDFKEIEKTEAEIEVNNMLKVAFFQKVRFVFQISKSPKKKRIFQKTIVSGKFKFQVQDSFLEYFFFLRFGDLNNTSHFLKKSCLYIQSP